ncbi:hypothetical protein U9M48_040823 [Paspalum notatum var. saurae]|uniref:MATH domain-containing protein n=1 Tax=Paspalum notatum var. saurae TaxID=547442 RepID=A0AAQ3ULY4_PASNO
MGGYRNGVRTHTYVVDGTQAALRRRWRRPAVAALRFGCRRQGGEGLPRGPHRRLLVDKTLPAGERVSSQQFTVGGRCWWIDYYPNGTDGSTKEGSAGDSIALYLRLVRTEMVTGAGYSLYNIEMKRVRAQYRFSLLDLDGND